MLKQISESITKRIYQSGLINFEDFDIYVYGLEVLISTVISFLTVLLVGIILSAALDAVLFLSVLIIVRRFTGGYHSKTFIGCNLSCDMLFLTSWHLSRILTFKLSFVVLIHLSGIVIVSAFAPVENYNKPLSAKKRKTNKKRAIITCSILSAITVVLAIMGSKYHNILTISYIDVLILLVCGHIIHCRREVKKNEDDT